MVLNCNYILKDKKKLYQNIYLVQKSANYSLQAKSAMPISLYIAYGCFTLQPELTDRKETMDDLAETYKAKNK